MIVHICDVRADGRSACREHLANEAWERRKGYYSRSNHTSSINSHHYFHPNLPHYSEDFRLLTVHLQYRAAAASQMLRGR